MDKYLSANEPLVDLRFLEDVPHKRQRPAWVLNEPIAIVGAWETLFHRRRTGTSQVDDEKLYAYEHGEQFVKEILGIGATLLITAYDKNYYVDEEEFALKRQLARHCKKHGLRLGVYIRADQIYSEVFADRLKREDLLARQADGRVPVYGNQEWRKNICFHKLANLEALRQSIRRAITELGVDLLHLDGLGVGGTETCGACRCDACRRDFAAFLQRRWGGDLTLCKRRFGHTHLEGIEPPGLMVSPAIPTGWITDPVWQEWIRFRCTWTARVTRLISEYVHELNPNVAILGNGSLAVRENAALLCGSDVGSYCQHLDILGNEDAFEPRLTGDGKIIQRVRQHKLTAITGAFLFHYMHQPDQPERSLRLQLSHAAAFNRGRITCLGFSPANQADFRLAGEVKRRYLDWLDRHWEHYQNLEPVADVTVWREARGMAFGEPLTYATAMQVEQLLIEDRFPFHIATGDWPADARVLVLPNLAFLDDAQCARVLQFVEDGGRLLVIGQTAMLDGWGRRRADSGLRAILPPGPGDFVRHQAGTGRVVLVPQLVDASTQPSLFNSDNTFNMGLDLTNWRVPVKAKELREALTWLLDDRPTFAVQARRGVLANYYQQSTTGRYYAHLVNLHDRRVKPVRLRMQLPAGSDVTCVRLLTPDDSPVETLNWRTENRALVATVEALDVYSVVVVELQLMKRETDLLQQVVRT